MPEPMSQVQLALTYFWTAEVGHFWLPMSPMSPIKLEVCWNCDTGRDKLADEARRQQQEELRRISSDMMQTSAASQQGTGRTGQDEPAASAQQGMHQP